MKEKKPLILLTGPTAVGKTKLSIALAKAVDGEIISADSAQVYKYMDIGSAKIKREEMEGVKHYLIDVLEPTEEFNVTIFQKMAKQCMEDIYSRGKTPIIVGGTGFYIQAVCYDIDFTVNEDNSEIRTELERMALEHGNTYLHEILKEMDPKSAEKIHANNVKRVIRAIEFYKLTKSPISEHNEIQQEKISPYDSRYFVLTDERETLYDRINQRVDKMITDGFVEEVKQLQALGCHRQSVSMQALGYQEILAYLEGEYSLEDAVYRIKRDTRHFAKRQLTWFRREKNVIWVPKNEWNNQDEKILEFLLSQI